MSLKEEAASEKEVVNDNDSSNPLLEKIGEFDRATSAVHNTLGVWLCFNLVFLGLGLSIVALVYLGETRVQIKVFAVASFLLWTAVNWVLVEIWKRKLDQDESTVVEAKKNE